MASDRGSVTMSRSLAMKGSVWSKRGKAWSGARTRVPKGLHPSIWPLAPFCVDGVPVALDSEVLLFGIASS